MLRYIYSFLFYLATPLLLVRVAYKTHKSHNYYKRWRERFGIFKAPKQKGAIWIHAVSVGETMAAVPLIKRLQEQYAKPIYITTMTPTGSERVKAIFESSVYHTYIPYDLPFSVKRFLNKVQPCALIIMETELWPNYLHHCKKRNIPILVANARLSEKSKKGYKKLSYLTKSMLNQINIIAAQNQSDADRFIELGALKNKVKVTGSMKFDINIAASVHEKASVFRDLWGAERLVWVAASTHEGEEDIILQAYKQVKSRLSNVLLALIPRHPERFDKVAQLYKKQGFSVVKRSTGKSCSAETDVFIGDSMGELLAQFAACDVAFVGGSLMPIGGHNLLEPAALGKAAITGPYVFNFHEITKMLIDAGAVSKVNNADELARDVIDLLTHHDKRVQAGQHGFKVVEQNKGAVEAHLELFKSFNI